LRTENAAGWRAERPSRPCVRTGSWLSQWLPAVSRRARRREAGGCGRVCGRARRREAGWCAAV